MKDVEQEVGVQATTSEKGRGRRGWTSAAGGELGVADWWCVEGFASVCWRQLQCEVKRWWGWKGCNDHVSREEGE